MAEQITLVTDCQHNDKMVKQSRTVKQRYLVLPTSGSVLFLAALLKLGGMLSIYTAFMFCKSCSNPLVPSIWCLCEGKSKIPGKHTEKHLLWDLSSWNLIL